MAGHSMRIAVRELVEYVLRSGDIRTASLGGARAVEGTKAHQRFQKAQGAWYQSEVKVEIETIIGNMTFHVHGRMDGLFTDDRGAVVDEIKTVGIPLDLVKGDNEVHWAQARIYAYIHARESGLERIGIRLTYIELEQGETRHFMEEKTFEELESFYCGILEKYVEWATSLESFHEMTVRSIEDLEFPFNSFRKGQKTFMAAVYKTIEDGQKLFARAPTGIGKTVAALYPSLKGYGKGLSHKIFYLTAKTIGKEVAADTMTLFESKGARIKRVILTAKEKTCLNGETKCSPEDCPYAAGHYDRVNKAIEDLYISEDFFSREAIEQKGKQYLVCPYELSLDMAVFSDVVICDYNYVFDPSAKLRRFFVEGSGNYTILIDEAHNLVDRGRDMYSAVLSKKDVLAIRLLIKDMDASLNKQLGNVNRQLLAFRKKCEEHAGQRYEEEDMPCLLEETLRNMLHRIEKMAPKLREWAHWEQILEFYFSCYDFVKKAELYSRKYITSYEKQGQDLSVRLYCLDPGENLSACLKGMKGVVFFSATLLPLNYYLGLLGGDAANYGMVLSSPFKQDNLKLIVDPTVSTFYNDREASAGKVAERVESIVSTKHGNYMVYFPSYQYLELVLEHFMGHIKADEVDVLVQERGLSEKMKEAFLKEFDLERERSLVAFSVLGGMFGEGIDLVGEKLIGVIVVGVGLPGICYERDLIKTYFAGAIRKGFDYAYVYPGMNKVMQAAGRVIRTVNDKGVVVLMDKRYERPSYIELFPEEWNHFATIQNNDELKRMLEVFWCENDGATEGDPGNIDNK